MSDVVLTKEVKIQFTVGYVAAMSEGVWLRVSKAQQVSYKIGYYC